jgi:D-serine deaminase-like pyridoxal phosphate-dependent protein
VNPSVSPDAATGARHDSAGWHLAANRAEIPSPALLLFPDRVAANIRQMIAIAGAPARLRPHVKTHKLPEVVSLQQAAGIQKFKCATIAEAEMLGGCGAAEVLLAFQPVGPAIARLLALTRKFPVTRFATIADEVAALHALSAAAIAARTQIEVLLDLDCGMHRTGVAPEAAGELYATMARLPGLVAGGLHAYDGHQHQHELAERRAAVDFAMQPVHRLRQQLLAGGCPVPRLVAGGSPSFPIHAAHPEIECSPGTCLLWDADSAEETPDLAFQFAAVLLTRVVSKPAGNRLCLDLGHKAVASEKPQPRVRLFELPEARAVMHSEEHLVIETPRAAEFRVGDVLHAIPRHICPTVALHAEVHVVRGGRAEERWKVVARDRRLTI